MEDRLGPHPDLKLPQVCPTTGNNDRMAALVHLVRHAEVDNPGHLVYADLPGFGLSPHGVEQARRAGRYLGPRPVVAIWSSPLERSLRTAEEIAARTGVPVKVDPDLTEWDVIGRWRGHAWRDIPSAFPGDLEAYLEHPESLAFAGETLEELAERMAAVARRLDSEHPHGDVVIVSHQDPIQAGILRLIGSPLGGLHQEKPDHGTVVTLRPGPAWRVETVWEPGDSPRFGEKRGLRVLEHAGRPDGPTSA
jgi:broad specificity phosphatase PhoE